MENRCWDSSHSPIVSQMPHAAIVHKYKPVRINRHFPETQSSDAQQKMSSSTFVHRKKCWSVTPDERPWLLFLNHRKQAINRTGDLYRALSAFSNDGSRLVSSLFLQGL